MPRSFQQAFDISRSLATGLKALEAAPWPLLLGAVLMQCTENSGGNGGGSGGSGGGDPWDDYDSWESQDWQGMGARVGELTGFDPASLTGNIGATELAIIVAIVVLVLGIGLVCGLMVLAFRSWVHGGYLRLHEEVLRTGGGSFGTLFGGADVFLRMMGFKVAAGLILTGIALLAVLPGVAIAGVGYLVTSPSLYAVAGLVGLGLFVPAYLYVWLGLYFGNHAVALDGLPILGAVEHSWDLARGNRLWMLLYLLVTGVVWMLGMCLCCVGIFLTRAIVDTARTEAYLLATRTSAESDDLWSLHS